MPARADEADEVYPAAGAVVPSRSVEIALGYLVDRVEQDCGTRHGATALYWHLIAVICQHSKTKTPVENKSETPTS
jgi:hypothetical protein